MTSETPPPPLSPTNGEYKSDLLDSFYYDSQTDLAAFDHHNHQDPSEGELPLSLVAVQKVIGFDFNRRRNLTFMNETEVRKLTVVLDF